MKTMMLSMFAILMLSSCGKKDEDIPLPVPAEPYVKFFKAQVNGVNLTFDDITVQKEVVPNSGNPYTDLVVTAKRITDTSSQVNFRLEYLQPGTESCYYFLYRIGDIEYDIEDNNSFEINVTKSISNKIAGTFHGLLYDFQNNPIALSNGSFEISF